MAGAASVTVATAASAAAAERAAALAASVEGAETEAWTTGFSAGVAASGSL